MFKLLKLKFKSRVLKQKLAYLIWKSNVIAKAIEKKYKIK